jgi:hypothetical protein
MEGDVPVPAESLRQLAIAATDEVDRHREQGRKSSADALERRIARAFKSLDGKDGEFVAVSPRVLSSLTAAGVTGAWDHADAAQVFLEKYGVWSDE